LFSVWKLRIKKLEEEEEEEEEEETRGRHRKQVRLEYIEKKGGEKKTLTDLPLCRVAGSI
jgi:hypothetical protein